MHRNGSIIACTALTRLALPLFCLQVVLLPWTLPITSWLKTPAIERAVQRLTVSAAGTCAPRLPLPAPG